MDWWETTAARHARALELAVQCQAEHVVGDKICYCVHAEGLGHFGEHVDYAGRKWRAYFSFTGRFAREQVRKQLLREQERQR